jgi:membrane protease YdiL (CAAX protease family)
MLTRDCRKIKPSLFAALLFLLCFALRVVELLVIRTDQSVVGEAFIHKLLGIALLAGALWFWRLKWQDIGFRGDKAARGIALGLLLGAGAFAIAYGVELFVGLRGGEAPSLSFYATSYGLAGNNALQSGFLFILMCVIGNIINVMMEDGIFRGLFMRLFGEKHSFVVSMILSSALFGIWHGLLPLRGFLDGEQSGAGAIMSALLLIVTSFVFGVELCLLCTWEGSLWAGMTVHFINNASVNLLHVVTASGVDEWQTVRITIAQTILFVAALALVLAQRRKGRKVEVYEQI